MLIAQISDFHLTEEGACAYGRVDTGACLERAIDALLDLDVAPNLVLATGDLTHSAKPEEFDTLDQMMKTTARDAFYVPGEHDTSTDDGKAYLEVEVVEAQLLERIDDSEFARP